MDQKKKPVFIYLCVLGIAMSFIGWLAENLARSVMVGIFDARFYILPFISAYALIVFAFYYLIGDPNDVTFLGRRIFKTRTKKTVILSNLVSLLFCFAFVFIAELVVGNLWDILFGVELWNYLNQPLHITQYTGVLPMLFFGGGGFILSKFVFLPSLRFLQNKMPYKAAVILVSVLGSLILIDTLRMIILMPILGEAPIYWSYDFHENAWTFNF